MIDVNECREHAERCMMQAAQATDPIIKDRLTETAQGWMRLAFDLAKMDSKSVERKDKLVA